MDQNHNPEDQFNNVPDLSDQFDDETKIGNPHGTDNEWFTILTMDDIANYKRDESANLVGDGHITREPGRLHTLAGYGGVGKTRMAFNLAYCGATGKDWLGYTVNNRWNTLIIQNENGAGRLHNDWEDLRDEVRDKVFFIELKQGAPFHEPSFRQTIHDLIVSKNIGMVIIDPWTNFVGDTDHKNYNALANDIFATLPSDPAQCPAVVVVAHCRKPPGNGAIRRGAELQQDILGSQVLQSRSRFILIAERADPTDLNDDRVLVTCAKASDAPSQPRGCFKRGKVIFTPVLDYDWDERDQPAKRGVKPAYVLSEVLDLMPLGENFKTKEWENRAKEELGISRTTFFDMHKRAVQLEMVIEVKRGVYRRPAGS